MVPEITEGRIIFNDLEAMESLFKAFNYDFDKLSLDDALRIRREFKVIIDSTLNNNDNS